MNKLIWSGLLLSSCLLACQKETVCTLQFVSVNVRISGDTLTDWYTRRQTTGDTIRLTANNTLFPGTYPVLDDSYQTRLANAEDVFTFVGLIRDSVVVREEYLIEADACHINKLSGRSEVSL